MRRKQENYLISRNGLKNYQRNDRPLGNDVHNVNVLTVIASESYDSFAKGLQTEMADAVADRPRAVTPELFEGILLKEGRLSQKAIRAKLQMII